ncbi:ubiquinone biosynthesis O-methyltransferase [mine drainage metagenome]|jgi:SAM-dependent methyltransferase|uniref:Ubiquinone biosynthesis O-methyltransferase n=1 Tax=mine drainage metagenome TaxID=410659 RepID=A0A1J5R4P7_9ZZZZ
MHEQLNRYGDVARPNAGGHGMDIASQRADELDALAIRQIESLVALAEGRYPIHALDVGCGRGGQAARMARAGAQVLAVDIEDHAADMAAAMRAQGAADAAWSFRRIGIAEIGTIEVEPRIVVCQRTIHYLRHSDALAALRTLRAICAAGAMLYLSASGLDSELGDGYPGANVDVCDRFAPLLPDRAAAHNIRPPVCLYQECELASLVLEAGWQVQQTFRSDFGNVKLVASRESCEP